MHLLYARFFTKILRDLGLLAVSEPFANLLTQGMVCMETKSCPKHGWLYPEEIDNGLCSRCQNTVVSGRNEKMSKSKKNVIDPDGLINRKAPGQPSRLNDTHRAAIAKMIESGPIPAAHGVVRWRLKDLARWIYEEFGVTLDETTLGRTLRAMGFRKLSARPRHYAQNELALEDFKKPSRPRWRRSARNSRPAPRSSSGGRMKRA